MDCPYSARFLLGGTTTGGLAMSQVTGAEYTANRRPFHMPVMLEEVVDLFRCIAGGVLVDATYGGGGHSTALLETLPGDVRVVGIDRDPDAISRAAGHARLDLAVGNFTDLEAILRMRGIGEISGVLFDLGVSSHQLDEPLRGFSYRNDGPLDMRMGPDASAAASELVNRAGVSDLARVIRTLGEERFAHRVSKAIERARPITSTGHLSRVVKEAIPAATRRSGGHPARRTFQALRMAVNGEMEALSSGLDQGIRLLRPGGRCVVISYHSLEERLVKHRFRHGEGRSPGPTLPVPPPVELVVLTRRPMRPRPDEVAGNPRSRSARLRAMEKAA